MASTKALAAIALTLAIVVPIGLGYVLAVGEETETGWETTSQASISDLLLNHQTPYYMEYSGASNNSMAVVLDMSTFTTKLVAPTYVSTGSKVSSLPVMTYPMTTLTLSGTHVPASSSSVYYFDTSARAVNVWLEYNDGQWEQVVDQGTDAEVAYNAGVAIVGSEIFTGISRIIVNGSGTLNIYEGTVVPNTYADPARGWAIGQYSAWINGQMNESVTMMVHLENGGISQIGLGILDSLVTIQRVGGIITVDGQELGHYSDVMVEVGPQGTSVSGISSWPTMGIRPTAYNTITVERDIAPFTSLGFIRSSSAIYRVDSTQAQAGTFPSTLDLTFDPAQLYPGVSTAIKLNSIGIYGETITIGGETYTVDNGQILIDGRHVSLKGALISSWSTEGGQYSVRINNVEIAESPSPATITFGGEWSLTATIFKLEETSRGIMAWHAGEFAFDKTTLCAAGLLTCGALLVVLGLTGRHSGVKIGSLLLVLGGAAMAYIIII